MVVFACSVCGDSLKLSQVEKHCQTTCRNCLMLSCIDCGKEFWGQDYAQHNKCISEEEKYSGKNFKPRPGAKKGEQKHELWTQQVQQAALKCKANKKLTDLLTKISNYPNIPRKKAKFLNFLKNSLRLFDTNLLDQAWDAIV
ncbi:hypothetical protein HELRODRAFT_88137 [Helobdella robusta]|uniref:Zinc finger C2H2 LYAR-type domain-containing protein n=1 Tax=Helobdella robusta TaxID=6412 RepID=T1G6Z0_HELRO|nr:hypothetical protein HELRODRAFT_88137 [Helobdella robusta]ESN93856.1 hypothetical protein HELRODRAFT_88137 [Helobdella robusta]